LLKPSSHTGSQVIVMGKPIGNMKAAEYHQAKTNLWRHVRDAYDSLALEYDFVVLEGAGSPAEINLKKNDIVNMNMAGYAGAVTLLAGDIDRGGVYAAFIGTMELLTPGERKLVAGYLVNKFRGDAGLLDMAHDYMLKYTGKPVLGVIPMIPDLNLPEEDSVTFKEQSGPRYRQHGDTKNKVVILVADFPHISNFTDIDALKREPDVCLKILSSSNHIPERWDLFILPGSKNVINDLCFLKESGIAGYLTREPEKLPGEVIGICGGFQMLGKMIGDPGNIESGISHEEGLSLLDMCTIMMKEKVLRQTTAEFLPAALTIKGYEIHHGETRANNLKPVIRDNNNRIIGCGNGTGNIWGTYLHGLFDNDQFRSWLLNRHRKNKHISGHGTHLSTYDINTEIDRLAAIVRSTINIDKIYRDLGIL
jgi:adenosylcobyric acid synthase